MTSPLVSNRKQRKFMAQMLTPTTRTRGIPLTQWRKSTARGTPLASAPSGGDLGLGNTAGQGIQGTSTNATSETDAARIEIGLPEDYVAQNSVTLKVRGRVGINRQVAQTIGISAKKVTDSAVGAELCATSAALFLLLLQTMRLALRQPALLLVMYWRWL